VLTCSRLLPYFAPLAKPIKVSGKVPHLTITKGQKDMNSRADLVVIGAGIVGCSTVHRLAELGWRNIVVVDQGPLFNTGGSTSHAPGLIFQTNYSKAMTHLAQETVRIYSSLELDDLPCYYPVGSLEVAYTGERLTDLKRKLGAAKSWGLQAELLSPDRTKELVPILDESKIHGAYHVPSDGIAKAVRVCEAMSREVGDAASFHGNTVVTGFDIAEGRVRAVITDQGKIETPKVLVCAGIWGPRIGRMANVSIPLIPVQHLYTLTSPLPELAGETREVVHPILRHQDYAMYFRQQEDRYGIGSYKHEPLLVDPDNILSPEEAEEAPAIREFTPEHFKIAHEAAIELIPPLGGVDLTYRINGMFSFTPDGFPVLGEAEHIEGFWVAEAVWVTHGGGVGKTVAEWMTEGSPGLDLREADINRFPPHARAMDYVRARGAQQYREVYDIIHPMQQIGSPRGIRLSPFHNRLRGLDAVFFESSGWEKPQWFESNRPLLDKYDPPGRTGWEAQNWSRIQGAEHLAARDKVCLFDLSSFAKFEITGRGSLEFLESISANRIEGPVGKVTYTALLNSKGGIKCDLTVTRLAHNRFWILTGGGTAAHDLAWIRSRLPREGSVHISDISSRYCGIGLWGPDARQTLSAVCNNDVSNKGFPYFTAREIWIGTVPAIALRVSYIGELGWEIYTPAEYGPGMWDLLWEAGRTFGMFALGGGAFNSLRLEKGYRLWGVDIHTDYNPFEAGLEWAVKLAKGNFSGRDALVEFAEHPLNRKLACLTLDSQDSVLLGKEPVLKDDSVVGHVTSTDYGYSVGKHIAYSYLPVEYCPPGTAVEIEYFGNRLPATVSDEPLYDPKRKRLTN
jgi:glycine cleavage system aminomethyltransferase T/glycine/D-amino acid oxidase-like deaminating enzyme